MYAIRQRRFGGPDTLLYEEVDDPVPGEGQVRIAVDAAGVHLLDTMIREGATGGPFPLPSLPMTPGREVAGTVDAVGTGVDPSWAGRRVVAHLGMASGGYAEMAVTTEEALYPLPDGVSFIDAVAMVGTGRTAMAILEVATITGDDVVLVSGAAGGIGSLLVQAASGRGAIAIGLAGGPVKGRLVESLGARVCVDYLEPEWPARVREWLGDRQVTVGLDGVGGVVGGHVIDLVAPGGRLVMFGSSSGEMTPLSAADLYRTGVTVTAAVGARLMSWPDGMRAFARAALEELAAGRLKPVVNPSFALAAAGDAHRALMSRATVGKVVLVP